MIIRNTTIYSATITSSVHDGLLNHDIAETSAGLGIASIRSLIGVAEVSVNIQLVKSTLGGHYA